MCSSTGAPPALGRLPVGRGVAVIVGLDEELIAVLLKRYVDEGITSWLEAVSVPVKKWVHVAFGFLRSAHIHYMKHVSRG